MEARVKLACSADRNLAILRTSANMRRNVEPFEQLFVKRRPCVLSTVPYTHWQASKFWHDKTNMFIAHDIVRRQHKRSVIIFNDEVAIVWRRWNRINISHRQPGCLLSFSLSLSLSLSIRLSYTSWKDSQSVRARQGRSLRLDVRPLWIVFGELEAKRK